MDADHFDSLTRALAPGSRRRFSRAIINLVLAGPASLVTLGAAQAGKGRKGGKRGKGKKKRKKKKELCVSVGTACTFSVHPCCDGAGCCETGGTPFRVCSHDCCAVNERRCPISDKCCHKDRECCGFLCCQAFELCIGGECVGSCQAGRTRAAEGCCDPPCAADRRCCGGDCLPRMFNCSGCGQPCPEGADRCVDGQCLCGDQPPCDCSQGAVCHEGKCVCSAIPGRKLCPASSDPCAFYQELIGLPCSNNDPSPCECLEEDATHFGYCPV